MGGQRSKAGLGCGLITQADQKVKSESVFSAIDSVPYFELWFFVSLTPKGGRGCLMSPLPLSGISGCHLIPLFYLLSCSYA